MIESVDRRVDIAVALGLIVICAIALFGTRDLPPGTFEPLGSAPVPQATAAIIIALCTIVIARASRRPHANSRAPDGVIAGKDDSDKANAGRAVITVLLTIGYIATIHMRLATFAVLTTVYLVLTIGWLSRFKPHLLPAIAATALVVGFGCQFIFTRVFIVDLPGL
ncbi:MAG: tripartite tricarboxylate transporter TctB family protein [Geminicoccaceae bacterium]|nr:tripartite tricarboxylate transporter TctB family protein [Geminicoccaceae bacterium]